MATKETALRKRQQIARANRMMFIWIAVASVIVGVSLVVSLMLVQRLMFNEKILSEKRNTISALRNNNEVVPELESNVRLLLADENLAKAKAKSDDTTLQVILDALPADANSLALGASLQSRLLGEVDGLRIESTNVQPVAGVEYISNGAKSTIDASDTETKEFYEIEFRFSVSGSPDALRTALQRLERSIRAIHVQDISTESSRGNLQMTVSGVAFYAPALTVELKDKTVKP